MRIDNVAPYQGLLGDDLVMHLNHAEARLLRDLLSRAGGRPEYTRRGLADAMIASFDSMGLSWQPAPDIRGSLTLGGGPRV